MKPVLIVSGVSKKYSRNSYAHRSYGFADLLGEVLGRRKSTELRSDEFWAVKDVSFTLYPGDSLAIVGRNGSGKSTLLKMLHGLIKPDEGKIVVDGTMQALINLGAGFDRSLSGRDNIFNAAAVVGMGRRETARRLEEIIDFSGLGDVIDSPVGTYSSGMYARLGFSVAIHLDPAIILIDEILAVGDVAFQNKCFARMHQLKQEQVAMVLVSHSHAQITQFCDDALWLEQGRARAFGESKDVVKRYLAFIDKIETDRVARLNKPDEASRMPPEDRARQQLYGAIYDDLDKVDDIVVDLCSPKGRKNVFRVNDPLVIHYRFRLKVHVTSLNVSLNICREDGLLMTTISTLNGDVVKHIHEGQVECRVTIHDLNLNPGEYVLVMPIHEGHSYLYRNVVASFRVVNNDSLAWGMMSFRHDYEIVAHR